MIGPGWLLLLGRLDRRLAADGVAPAWWPRIAAVGAGELRLAVPAGASLRTLRRVAAVSRLSRRCCEVCLRSPAEAVWPTHLADPQMGRLCAWHAGRLDGGKAGHPIDLATLRMEAWMAYEYGDGPLRALQLGARLSPSGLRAALEEYAGSEFAAAGEVGWITPGLVHHAIEQLPVDLCARLTPPDVAPLLGCADASVRELGLGTLARMAAAAGDLRGYLARLHDGPAPIGGLA